MNRSPSNRVGGAVLALAAVALPAGAQDKPAKKDAALEALRAAAARQNPDVAIAEAKVREAEALLAKARAETSRKVIELYTQRQHKREEEAALLRTLEQVKQTGVAPEEARVRYEDAVLRHEEARKAVEQADKTLRTAREGMSRWEHGVKDPTKEPEYRRLQSVAEGTEKRREEESAALREAAGQLERYRAESQLVQQKPDLEKGLAKVRAELVRLDAELAGLTAAPLPEKLAPAPPASVPAPRKPAPAKEGWVFAWTPAHDNLREFLSKEAGGFKPDQAWTVQDAMDFLSDRFAADGAKFVIRGRGPAAGLLIAKDPWEVRKIRLDLLLLLIQDETPGLQFYVLEYGLVIGDKAKPPERAVRLQDFLKMKPPAANAPADPGRK